MAQDFTAQYNRAVAAAQQAGDTWLAKHGDAPDTCGYAYVTTRMNTAFGRWVSRNRRGGKWLTFNGTHTGYQQMSLNEAMAIAALNSLTADGVQGLGLHTWID